MVQNVFSSCTPMKYLAHPALEITTLEDRYQAQEGQFELKHKCSLLY